MNYILFNIRYIKSDHKTMHHKILNTSCTSIVPCDKCSAMYFITYLKINDFIKIFDGCLWKGIFMEPSHLCNLYCFFAKKKSKTVFLATFD